MNPHTNERVRQHAEEKVRLANERFGYQQALLLLLHKTKCPDPKGMLELARTRQLDEFERNL
jgi:hypothetical protein